MRKSVYVIIRETAVINGRSDTIVIDEYQAALSIDVDINVAQNAGSIIDRPSAEVSSLFAFSAS